MSPSAYIGFGSNLCDREAKFKDALQALGDFPATTVKGHSRLYETEPIGLSDNGFKFLNAAIALETGLSPIELIKMMRDVEVKLGKSLSHKSDMSRVIDLDLLLYGDQHISRDGLEVPHPRMHHRAFVLMPLAEIAPHALHPVLGCTVGRLLETLSAENLAGCTPWTF
jgi:2-amino-4-hydroxy-6-hydroxymethyldihydropteridine diphosphokinase